MTPESSDIISYIEFAIDVKPEREVINIGTKNI